MIEFYYLDREGRELGSIHATSFTDAHAWLGHMGVKYHELTKFRPRAVKRPGTKRKKWAIGSVLDPEFDFAV